MEAILTANSRPHSLQHACGKRRKRSGHTSVTQQQIHALLIKAAREGLEVVRLKSGDPLVFGRDGEETGALRRAGIDFEVVPGISAGFGAAAHGQIPLSDLGLASTIVLLSNHCCAVKAAQDWRRRCLQGRNCSSLHARR